MAAPPARHPAPSLARKLQALAAIPDADLLFFGARQSGRSAQEVGQELLYLQPLRRARHCPSPSLLDAAGRHYPFLTSAVLVPRWRLSEAGLSNPDLRRGEDEELFLRLALRQVRVGEGRRLSHAAPRDPAPRP